jgi:pimeloyl-ACP methyl ester carboxylesterase
MGELTPDLEKHVIPGVGHWVQWEAPEAVTALICSWLERRHGSR